MRQFNIIIPHLRDHEKLENTLVSVLQHRPSRCEVTVVHSCEYDNPYDLPGDEVTFIPVGAAASLVDLIEIGVSRSRADVVHLLQPGLEVVEGWEERALEHFDDESVASVAPLILADEPRHQVVSAGLQFGPSGRRRLSRTGARYKQGCRFRAPIVGPHWNASFYRRVVLQSILAGGNVVGDQLADLDWALVLKRQGWRCQSESGSQVVGQLEEPRWKTVRDGRHLQRLFMRHRQESSWLLHPFAWLRDVVQGAPSLAAIRLPVGRLLACFESREKRDPSLTPSIAGRVVNEEDDFSLRRAA